MEYRQSLDLDKCDKEQLNEIVKKIKLNPCCKSINIKDSCSKGYHIFLVCSKKCDICRFVFDDMKRYEIDFNREEKFKNIAFNEKEYFTGNLTTIKHSCERCKRFNINITMSKRELEIQEIRKKLIIGKINDIPYQLVYLAYDYFECPICHWFKFIKKKDYHLTG